MSVWFVYATKLHYATLLSHTVSFSRDKVTRQSCTTKLQV